MCGEYFTKTNYRQHFIGSPPHVWRILNAEESGNKQDGITSTCVENTLNESRYSNNPYLKS